MKMKMKTKACLTPFRVLDDGKIVYFLDDMTCPIREAVREYTGIHNPFDDEGYVTFKEYNAWINTL